MTALPTWAQSKHARSLIAAIIATPPECRAVRFGDSHYTRVPQYLGPYADALRQIYRASEHRAAVFSETPDGLIEALLQDAATERDLRFTMELQRKDEAA